MPAVSSATAHGREMCIVQYMIRRGSKLWGGGVAGMYQAGLDRVREVFAGVESDVVTSA
jgi:hypothetical protein